MEPPGSEAVYPQRPNDKEEQSRSHNVSIQKYLNWQPQLVLGPSPHMKQNEVPKFQGSRTDQTTIHERYVDIF